MKRGRRVLLLGAAAFALGARVSAMEIEQAESKYRDKHYQLRLVTVVDAPQVWVQAVLHDYPHYPQLDPRILEARVLSRSGPHDVVLYTKLRACFGVFCRTVKRVESVTELDSDLTAAVVPEQSDVLSGETHTHLAALDGRTRITYTTSVVPGFWMPPFIGRPLMLRTLREASIDLFRHVEQQAQSLMANRAPGP